jgi:hypothetical protein
MAGYGLGRKSSLTLDIFVIDVSSRTKGTRSRVPESRIFRKVGVASRATPSRNLERSLKHFQKADSENALSFLTLYSLVWLGSPDLRNPKNWVPESGMPLFEKWPILDDWKI